MTMTSENGLRDRLEVAPLERLVAKDAIIDVLYSYARAIDRLDAELLLSVFWDDGGFEDGIVDGAAPEFVPVLIGQALPSMFASTQHLIGNATIKFGDADTALCESCFLAYHLVHAGEAALDAVLGPRRMRELGGDYTRCFELQVGGRYFDRFERRAGNWRIKTRRFVCDFTSSGPDSSLKREGFAAHWKLAGSRSRDDPSYRFCQP